MTFDPVMKYSCPRGEERTSNYNGLWRILRLFLIGIWACSFALALSESGVGAVSRKLKDAPVASEKGPLRLHPHNPRYFTDTSGKAIYLTGSHNDPNLMDIGKQDPPPRFDFEAHLAWLEALHHNFIRLWRWTEAPKFMYGDKDGFAYVEPHPWKRTGPGIALDGKPKFDLSSFEPMYFQRIRERALAAKLRGFYVSIMLFEGNAASNAREFWRYHPFHRPNNTNGIEADRNGDGKGLEFYGNVLNEVTELQLSYVRHVIDTVNDLDNILYEVCNECHEDSTDWQYMIIRYVKEYERSQEKQHPVGMTALLPIGRDVPINEILRKSPADWISPKTTREANYASDPPPANFDKVSILDSDHITPGGSQVDAAWVWKSFTRGHNPIFLDLIDRSDPRVVHEEDWDASAIRRNMGQTLRYAEKMSLVDMIPDERACSSGYCLVNPGKEYLVYVPTAHSSVELQLEDAPDRMRLEWFNPNTGEVKTGSVDQTGRPDHTFTVPFATDAILYLVADEPRRR